MGNLGAEYKHIASHDLPEHAASRNFEVGKHLYNWKLADNRGFTYSHAPVYVMIMAIVCPEFRLRPLKCLQYLEFRDEIAKSLLTIPYGKYAAQL
ncbi:hypothetical protein GGI02_003372, partial [Coemansia sp. RSA 2322]